MLPGLGLAVAGVVTGLTWRLPAVGRLDALGFRSVNRSHLPRALDAALAVLRLTGTTPVFIAALVLTGLARPAWAFGLALAGIAVEGVTKGLKLAARRQRPFAAETGVILRMSRLPVDPSFPSGDAMRAAFLAGLVMTVADPWAGVVSLLLAGTVALGRVRSGAHYPLDIWAGFLLGLGAALAWAGALGR